MNNKMEILALVLAVVLVSAEAGTLRKTYADAFYPRCTNENETLPGSSWDHYSKCQMDLNGDLRSLPVVCPNNTYYDPNKAGTDDCCCEVPGGGRIMFVDQQACCDGDFVGLKPHDFQANYYYYCAPVSGIAVMACPGTEVFDPVSGMCKEEVKTRCCVLLYDQSHGLAYAPDCTDEGLFAVPGRSDFYRECHLREGRFFMAVKSCPMWEGFDTELGKCTPDAWTPPPIEDDSWYLFSDPYPPCRKAGVFAVPKNRSLYYSCSAPVNGKRFQTRFICPPNTYFDEARLSCVCIHTISAEDDRELDFSSEVVIKTSTPMITDLTTTMIPLTTVTIEPEITTPEPICVPVITTLEPEVTVCEPEPETTCEPEITTPEPEPEIIVVEPEIVTPEPASIVVEPEIITPEPEPETTTCEPETPEPETTTPVPETTTCEPEIITPEPEPEPTTPEPEIIVVEPEIVTPEPEIIVVEPEIVTPEPEIIYVPETTTICVPETTTPEPETTTPTPFTTEAPTTTESTLSPCAHKSCRRCSTPFPECALQTSDPMCKSEGFFRHVGSCHRYYQCVLNECGVLVKTRDEECPRCLRFNPRTGYCDYPENVPECMDVSQPNFQCPREGAFRITGECNKYFACHHLRNGTFRLTVERCPPGSGFNPDIEACDYSLTCQPKPVPVCPKLGYMPDDQTCSKYYKCFESLSINETGLPVLEAVAFTCPLGLVFDQKTESCMDPAKCDMPGCGCKNAIGGSAVGSSSSVTSS